MKKIRDLKLDDLAYLMALLIAILTYCGGITHCLYVAFKK